MYLKKILPNNMIREYDKSTKKLVVESKKF